MDFFGIGPLELLIVAVVALLVLGPERLPQMALKAGKFLHQAKSSIADARESILGDVNAAVDGKKEPSGQARAAAAPPVQHQPGPPAAGQPPAIEATEQHGKEPSAEGTAEQGPALRRLTH